MLEAHAAAGGPELTAQVIPAGDDGVDGSLADVAEGGMTDVVGQGDGVDQVQLHLLAGGLGVDADADVPGDDLDLDGVGQSGSDLSHGRRIKQLGLVLHAAKLGRGYDFFDIGIIDMGALHMLPPGTVHFLHRTTFCHGKSTT